MPYMLADTMQVPWWAPSTCGGTYLRSAPPCFFPSTPPALTTTIVAAVEVVASPILCSSLCCCLVARFDFFVARNPALAKLDRTASVSLKASMDGRSVPLIRCIKAFSAVVLLLDGDVALVVVVVVVVSVLVAVGVVVEEEEGTTYGEWL